MRLPLAILATAVAAQAATFTTRGTGGNNTGATTLAITPGSSFTAGTFGVLVVAVDNEGSGGNTAIAPSTVTDSVGNVWTRRLSGIRDPGAAGAGAEVAIYTADVTTALTTSNNITITWGGSTSPVAKAWTLTQIAADTGKIIQFGRSTTAANDSSTTPSVATAMSVAAGDIVVGGGAAEKPSSETWSADGDTSNGTWTAAQTTGFGTTTSAMSVQSELKVTTGTATQTYNPAFSPTARDWVVGIIVLREFNPADFFNTF